MKVLIVTSKWPQTSSSTLDGGIVTAFDIIEAIKGYADIDILLPEAFKDMPPKGFGKVYFYKVNESIWKNYENDRFNCRVVLSDSIAKTLRPMMGLYDRIIVLHIFHLFKLASIEDKLSFSKIVLFPMMLTPSYKLSSEDVPESYTNSEKIVLQKVGKVITPSFYEYNQLTSFYQADSSKIKIVPRSVNTDVFCGHNHVSTHHPLQICCIGRIKKQKRNVMAVDLLKSLQMRNVTAHMNFIGDIQDESEYTMLKQQISDNSLGDCVSFYPVVSRDKLSSVFDNMDFNISFAYCETFGRAIFEGLYCGIPAMIMNKDGSLKQMIGQDHGACFYNNVDEMAEDIVNISRSSKQYEQLSCQAITFGTTFSKARILPILRKELL